jgi:hypothetical protein
MYFVFMIRQEVDYQVIVVEDACDVPAALALNFGQAPDAQAEVAHRLRLYCNWLFLVYLLDQNLSSTPQI